jgi:hypothetical protein
MTSTTAGAATQMRRGLLRHPADGWLVGLSLVHAALLLEAPSIPLVAVGLWWNANTIAHNFIHQPFFRPRAVNRLYSCALSVLLGFPQSMWKQRHLAHHADRTAHIRVTRLLVVETTLVFAAWGAAAALAPRLFFLSYLPGWALGLALCSLQGHYEHAGGTTSHYGWIYNALFFNDGYHVEHHRHPGTHWTDVDDAREGAAAVSRWPPVLRWLEHVSLEGLERLVVHVPLFQRVVVAIHERACHRLLAHASDIRSVLIVGGGLFPRTALVMRRALPHASLTIVDANDTHLAIARRFLDAGVTLRSAWFTGTAPPGVDLVVVPLAYVGNRSRLYDDPPARLTLIHDWLWHRRGRSAIVSVLLLKRLNLIQRERLADRPRSQEIDPGIANGPCVRISA